MSMAGPTGLKNLPPSLLKKMTKYGSGAKASIASDRTSPDQIRTAATDRQRDNFVVVWLEPAIAAGVDPALGVGQNRGLTNAVTVEVVTAFVADIRPADLNVTLPRILRR